ncbi:MAG TPA: NAD(P)H-binding protein [Gemmatimonadaceae bacterium]|nr:NAD(P)H-binding protein [Gemmatimonadaceae bacterium]
MATILLTGASGVLGQRLLAHPDARAHRLRAMSRRSRPETASHDGVEWVSVDLATGEGLEGAVAGADVIVHAASDPRGDSRRVDVEGTERLLATARRTRARHFIYLSIVGVDRIPLRYYEYKAAAERVVSTSGVPWTILRGTQFHDFMDFMCGQMARFPVAVVPRGWLYQPIHVDEFAAEVWRSVAAGPRERAPDFAGPEVMSSQTLMREWLVARRARKPVLAIPIPGRVARALRRGEGTAPGRMSGSVTWRAWLAGSAAAAAAHGRSAPAK